MSLAYDAQIIQEAAENLYAEAESIVRTTMIRYGFFCFLVGAVFGGFLASKSDNTILAVIISIAFATIGALAGRSAAKAKAFELKLRAQTALCQVQIEKNVKK